MLYNRYKGADIASIDSHTGELVRLFNPRQDRWTEHFRFDGATVETLSAIGGVTASLLRLNATERIAERLVLQDLGVYPR